MTRPHITLSREDVFRLIGIIAAAGGVWVAVEARMTKVETRQEEQAQASKELREDVREIRRDVKRLLARDEKPR